MNEDLKQRLADGGAIVSGLGWIMSHIAQINSVLQTVLLIVSIVAGLFAIRYHHRKTPR